MLDFSIEEVIIADTVEELMEKLEPIDDDIILKPKEGIWVGVYPYAAMEDTFVDAFDHTVYQHEIYEPVKGEGELCLGLYKNLGEGFPQHQLVNHTGELKALLQRHVSPKQKVLSVDDNFELNGAITKGVKLVLIRRDDGFMLDLK